MKYIHFKNMYSVNLETGYIKEVPFADRGLIYKASRVGDLIDVFLKLLPQVLIVPRSEVELKANYKGGYLLEWTTDGMYKHTVEAEILKKG